MSEDSGTPQIPEPIQKIVSSEDLKEMRDLRGWATGTVVVHSEDGSETKYEHAWIELFNGEGSAPPFGGVRFFVVENTEVIGGYAFPSLDDAERVQTPYLYVEDFDQEDVMADKRRSNQANGS